MIHQIVGFGARAVDQDARFGSAAAGIALPERYQNRFGVESNGQPLDGFNAELTIAERQLAEGDPTIKVEEGDDGSTLREFEVRQPNVSRWERYWLAGNWPDLLSLKSAEVLTREVRAKIIQVCAAFPWWGIQQVHAHLRQQGLARSPD